MILSAENLCKSYGAEQILKDISLTVEPGQSIAVLGTSGRGKSTLISIMGLLLQPDSGTLSLDGENILQFDDASKSKIRNQDFGFLFQHTQLIGSITVLDNVLVPALLARKKGMEQRAKELLDNLGLSHRLYHYPHQLSIGQKRRVSIARALLLEPQIVFADEPTNDLDEENAELVGKQLFKLPEEGKTLILVTHDKDLAARAERRLEL